MPREFKVVREARARGVTVLCWTSFVAAVIGGPLVAGMFLGQTLAKVLEAIPWPWMPAVALVVLVVILIRDLMVDGEPNYQAIFSLLVMPSVASAGNGKLGDKIGEWTGAVLNLIASPLREWLGTSAPVALALAVAATAILLAQRTVKKGHGGMGMAH
jgi:hypothetical protein